MFGRKPQLPIDSLLGITDKEVVEGTIEEWIRDQQEFLQFAYTSADIQPKAAATQHVQRNQEETVSKLPVSTVVYKLNYVQGRCKIQDIWKSSKYKVVRCVDYGG